MHVIKIHDFSPWLYLSCFQVFFLPNRPFHLGGKTFKLLMDIFLFHDFSVMGFIQGLKVWIPLNFLLSQWYYELCIPFHSNFPQQYCMTQHFFEKNWTVLSCMPEELPSSIKKLTKEDIESIRALPSVRKHINGLKENSEIISWLKNDVFVKVTVDPFLK